LIISNEQEKAVRVREEAVSIREATVEMREKLVTATATASIKTEEERKVMTVLAAPVTY
jgi:hypothetical protein